MESLMAAGGRRGLHRLAPSTVRRTLLALLLVAILPMLILQAGLHYNRFQEERAQELEANLEVARAVGATFDAYTDHLVSQELAIGVAFTAPQPPDTPQMTRLLKESLLGYPSLRYYVWVDPEGHVIASSSSDAVGLDLSDRSYFREIVQGRDWVVGNLLIGKLTGEPTFAVARGVRDEGGTLIGVVAALVDPGRLGDVLGVQRAGRSDIAIMDGQGRLVYRYPEVPLTWEQRMSGADSSPVRNALTGKEVGSTSASAVDGRETMMALTPIRSIGWVAMASHAMDEAMAPVVEDLAREFLLLLMVAVFSVVAALLSARYLTTPIRKLRDHALAIGRGQAPSPLTVSGPVEVEALASAFNRMSREITLREAQREQLLEHVQQTNRQLAIAGLETQKMAEEATRRVAELDATISAVADGLVLYDPHGGIVHMNATAKRMLGYAEDQRGLSVGDRLQLVGITTESGHPFEADATPAARALAGEVVRNVPMVLHPSAGKPIWISASAAPIRGSDGRILGAVATFADVTAQRESLETQEDLLRAISHDLRTPLTSILGYAEYIEYALEKADWADDTKRSAQIVAASARHMNSMIQDLVDVTRVESGQLTLNCSAVRIGDLVDEMKGHLAGAIEVDRVEVSLPADLPALWADPPRLERILTNIVINALKYSPSSSAVVIGAEAEGNEVKVFVKDQGIGIAPEDIPHLFDRFYRAVGARKTEGLGLGLYVTRSLVEAHGGRIWVESNMGTGTTFYFAMPVAGLDDELRQQPDSLPGEGSSPATSTPR